MTKEEFDNLKLKIEEAWEEHSLHWRRGQTVFNTLYELYPDIADDIRGTQLDPFYNDSNVIKCLKYIHSTFVNVWKT